MDNGATVEPVTSKPPSRPPPTPRKDIVVREGGTDLETLANAADLIKSPEHAAYRVIEAAEHNTALGPFIDSTAMLQRLRDQAVRVNRGDLAEFEAMLANQATGLQSLFSRLVDRGMGCEGVVAFEANMRMALRAQAQCRATIETLATIKNPPVVFAKQVNTANQQIVNNGTRAREVETEQNKLLECVNGERLDAGTQGTASRTHPAMETVGDVYRPQDAGGYDQGRPQRIQRRAAGRAAADRKATAGD